MAPRTGKRGKPDNAGGGNPAGAAANGPGSDNPGEGGFIDPTSAVARDTDSGPVDGEGIEGKRKYKRREKSGDVPVDPSFIAFLLQACHMQLAAVLNDPVWNLSDAESERMAQASLKLASFYGVGGISPQVDAWLKFGGAAGAIYGPRILGSVMRPTSVAPRTPQKEFHMTGTADGTGPVTGHVTETPINGFN